MMVEEKKNIIIRVFEGIVLFIFILIGICFLPIVYLGKLIWFGFQKLFPAEYRRFTLRRVDAVYNERDKERN